MTMKNILQVCAFCLFFLAIAIQSKSQTLQKNYAESFQSFPDSSLPKLLGFGEILDIVESGNSIYIGGTFTNADGNDSLDYIAYWNGKQWRPLGTGLNNKVFAIAVKGDTVYAGGLFKAAGGDPNANYVAMWDGEQWKAVGAGLAVQTAIVYDIAIAGDDVYVGGYFSNMGNNAAIKNIARFDGTDWHPLKNGFQTYGQSLKIVPYKNGVIVGGDFASIDNNSDFSRIAYWNGTDWEAFGKGVNNVLDAIKVVGDDVYVGGYFTQASEIPANYIAKWDGSTWSALGDGVTGRVYAIEYKDGHVWVGGNFEAVDGNENSKNIVRWDQTQWHPVENGLNGHVYALQLIDEVLFIGGEFNSSYGNTPFGYEEVHSGFTYYNLNGYYWKSLIPDLNGPVAKILETPNGLIIGGGFTNVGGNEDADYIIKWDGNTVEPIGNGLSSYLNSFTLKGDTIIVVGNFLDAGGDPDADRIAMLVNNEWKAIDNGINNGNISTIESIGTTVYIGGSFYNINGNDKLSYILKWEGDTFLPVGAGLNGGVGQLIKHNNMLYVFGQFERSMDNIRMYKAGKWDGESWSALSTMEFPSGATIADAFITDTVSYFVGSNAVFRMKDGIIDTLGGVFNNWTHGVFADENGILVTGRFTENTNNEVVTQNLNRVARWDGTKWIRFGSGISNNYAYKSMKLGDDYLIYGGFSDAGNNKQADNIAVWGKYTYPVIVSNETQILSSKPNSFQLLQNYPNPFNPSTVIQFTLPVSEAVSLSVYSIDGRLVKSLLSNKQLISGTHEIQFDGSGLASGIYLYRLETSSQIATQKMTLIK